MAKYAGTPFYAVNLGGKQIEFNFFGEYETNDAEDIKKLDALTPAYFKRVDATDAEEKPKPTPKKAPAKRKTSAK